MWDNPEPKETPCFNFEVEVTTKLKGYVFAEDESKAIELIHNKQWDEADFVNSEIEVKEVVSIKEDIYYD